MSDRAQDLAAFAEELGQRISSQITKQLNGVPPIQPEYLSPAQAARMTGFTLKALESLRARRAGPRYFKVGASVRYCAADVRAWIEGGSI